MKLSKYVGLVKKESCCVIHHIEDGTWLGTRAGIYKAEGLPDMSGKEQVRTVLDIDKSKMEKIYLREEYHDKISNVFGLDLRDNIENEQNAKKIQVMAVKDGHYMSCLQCDDGELVFYDEGYLAPLADVMKESEYMQMLVRVKADGTRYIAVKDGFVIVAVILPLAVLSEDYLESLHDFLIMCSEQYDREKARGQHKEKDGQLSMKDAEKEGDEE